MKKVKTIFMSLFLAASVACAACSCDMIGQSTDTYVQSSSSSLVVDTTDSKYSDDNDTKVKQMLGSVTLNGKPLKIPYKLGDLGEGYTFDKDVYIYEDKYPITTLFYNGTDISSVGLLNYSEDQSINDFVADSIDFTYISDPIVYDMLKVDGICGNNKITEVYDKFGKPTTQEEVDSGKAYNYKIDDNCYISFWGNNNNDIISISITNRYE